MYAADTAVPVTKTRGEIEQLLERHKARQYGTAVDYEVRTARVQFRLHDRVVRFVIRLPERGHNVKRYEQAERQRWRALLLVLKAKLESVESGIETFEQSFLSQIVLPSDDTLGDVLPQQIAEIYAARSGRLLLNAMPGDVGDAEP